VADLAQAACDHNRPEILAVQVLISHQRYNLRLLSLSSAIMFTLGLVLFIILYLDKAITELGPALGNLLTFVASLFPITGVVTANNRIGDLEAASILLASQTSLTAHEEDLLKDLLKK
jgi:hypothetical protein